MMAEFHELDERIAAIQAQTASAVYAARLNHDPSAAILDGVAMHTDVQREILSRIAASVRAPISDEEIRRIWAFAQAEARRSLRQRYGWRQWLIVGVITISALVGSAAAGYGFAGGWSITCHPDNGGNPANQTGIACGYWLISPTTIAVSRTK